jgi:vitamin B12 transporter
MIDYFRPHRNGVVPCVTEMGRRHLERALQFFCLVIAFFFQCAPLAAQSEEEMKVLSMFYMEKDLVVTPTRYPKPVSRVAENMTVVTAAEIKDMNAHTVAEVLSRVNGLFVNFNRDFGAASLILAQGSEQRHVLVLLDGMPWNSLSDGSAETNSIPVGIIDRIEIIKGPASSTWGSSLGGVINILTKAVGNEEKPGGSIRASYGERHTGDYRAEISGRAGAVGYYSYYGHQSSDGLRSSRDFNNNSFYTKWNVPFSENFQASLSAGYSEPDLSLGDFPSQDITSSSLNRTFFIMASLGAFLTPDLKFDLTFHRLAQKLGFANHALGQGFAGLPGELFLNSTFDEETTGTRGKLVWEKAMHTLVLGIDYDRGTLDQTLEAGPLLQSAGLSPVSSTHPSTNRWAAYVNDTIEAGRWSFTPGIRYDRTSITGSFVSPSLGATYRVREDTVLRASIARGFTNPPLSSSSGGNVFLDPNPNLEPETVWSYQLGLESAPARFLWFKTVLFHHELDHALERRLFAAGPPTFNDLVVNDGKVKRRGFEIEAELRFPHNISLFSGFAYVDFTPPNEEGADEIYSSHIGLKYDDRESFKAQLFGSYVWWDLDARFGARYDDFIWTLNLTKKIRVKDLKNTEAFATIHNLFNGSQYLLGDNKNPGRWVEAGIRMGF